MMQNLLAEPFHLRFHRVTKVLPAYELVVANGGFKRKESSGQVATMPDKTGAEFSWAVPPFRLPRSCNIYSRNLENYQLVDKTGLTGKYDIFLELAPSNPYQRRALRHHQR